MKLLTALLALAPIHAFAGPQTLEEAMRLNPRLAAAYQGIKAAAGVDCITNHNPQSRSIRGPNGRPSVTLQSACFDPNAFNPSQLGQLTVTYYGNGATSSSPVGDVIEIQFEVFK